jgi:hypothetical protein
MTTQEKRLLNILFAIFFLYILPFQLYPLIYNYYNDYTTSVEKLNKDIERYKKLSKNAEYWEKTNKDTKQLRDQIYAGLLSGETRELIGAKMQALIKNLAQRTGIRFKTLDPPDTSYTTGQWLLVVQSMQFEATSYTLMRFLQAVENARVHLKVTTLDVRARKTKLNCKVRIAGFSRAPATDAEDR